MKFEVTQTMVPETILVGVRPMTSVSCGIARLSGLRLPLGHHGLMAAIYSTTKDIVEEYYGVSMALYSTERERKSEDEPIEFRFYVNYEPLERTSEPLEDYDRRCAESFENVAALFAAQIEAFVKSPNGLPAYLDYIEAEARKDAPATKEEQTRRMHEEEAQIKQMRDIVMREAGFRTKAQIDAKRRVRNARARQEDTRAKRPNRAVRQTLNEMKRTSSQKD